MAVTSRKCSARGRGARSLGFLSSCASQGRHSRKGSGQPLTSPPWPTAYSTGPRAEPEREEEAAASSEDLTASRGGVDWEESLKWRLEGPLGTLRQG